MSILSALNNPAAMQAVLGSDMSQEHRQALANRARRERIMNIASILGEQDPAVQDGMMNVPAPPPIRYGNIRGPIMASAYSQAGGYR